MKHKNTRADLSVLNQNKEFAPPKILTAKILTSRKYCYSIIKQYFRNSFKGPTK